MDLNRLSDSFPVERLSFRVGSTTQAKDKGMALAYIDARDVYTRLDEVCGPENKLEAFIDSCRPYGVKSVVRTGTVAMARYNRTKSEQ